MSRPLTCQDCGKTEERAARGNAKRCIACAVARVAQIQRGKTRVGKLIHALIEERAQVIAWKACHRRVAVVVDDDDRDQARREIEAEVLTPRRTP